MTDDEIKHDALSEEKMRWYEDKKGQAEEIYEAEIRHLIGLMDEDKYVETDVLTCDHEIHENSANAGSKLRKRRPDAVIHTLPVNDRREVSLTLAGASTRSSNLYTARVLWHDHSREVEAVGPETDALIGMGLLRGSNLSVDTTVLGGSVVISELPARV